MIFDTPLPNQCCNDNVLCLIVSILIVLCSIDKKNKSKKQKLEKMDVSLENTKLVASDSGEYCLFAFSFVNFKNRNDQLSTHLISLEKIYI